MRGSIERTCEQKRATEATWAREVRELPKKAGLAGISRRKVCRSRRRL